MGMLKCRAMKAAMADPVALPAALQGKTIALFAAVPGAFTPTCSKPICPVLWPRQMRFKAAGVDEIWCVAVNDAFVMGRGAASGGWQAGAHTGRWRCPCLPSAELAGFNR